MERDSSDELSLWVDRVKQTATATLTYALADTDEAFRIGAAGNVEGGDEADGMYFVGLIDEVRLSKTARGAAGKLCSVQIDYIYNARNQLVTETSGASVKTYSYDQNGNTTDIDEKVGAVTVAEEDMTYDKLNRMTAYTGPRGSESFSYRGAEWHRFSADGTNFFYDGDNVLVDVAGGAVDRLYVTPFLDQNLSMTTVSATYYYSQDGLGSVRTLTNSTGNMVIRYDYLPFGNRYSFEVDDSVAQVVGFQGRERTSTGGLQYFRHRYYLAGVGRFVSRDPLAELVQTLPHHRLQEQTLLKRELARVRLRSINQMSVLAERTGIAQFRTIANVLLSGRAPRCVFEPAWPHGLCTALTSTRHLRVVVGQVPGFDDICRSTGNRRYPDSVSAFAAFLGSTAQGTYLFGDGNPVSNRDPYGLTCANSAPYCSGACPPGEFCQGDYGSEGFCAKVWCFCGAVGGGGGVMSLPAALLAFVGLFVFWRGGVHD